jgi:hypothetical protein
MEQKTRLVCQNYVQEFHLCTRTFSHIAIQLVYSVKSENHNVENEVQAIRNRAVSSHWQNRVVIHLLFFNLNFYYRFVGTTGEE